MGSCKPLIKCTRGVWLVALLALAWVGPCALAQQTEVLVTTGQQLVDEMAAWEVRLDNTTLYLGAGLISLRNVSLPPVRPPLASAPAGAQLTITRAPNVSQAVLDTANVAGLLSSLGGQAAVTLGDITLVNLCNVAMPRSGSGIVTTHAFVAAFITFSRVVSTRVHMGTVMYGLRAQQATDFYHLLVTATLAPVVRERGAWMPSDFSNPQITMLHATHYAIQNASYKTAANTAINVTYKALDNPTDPLLAQLRAQGVIMPPQYCNGTAVPAEMANAAVYTPEGRVWFADDTATAVDGLQEACALSYLVPSLPLKHVPAVYLDGSAVLSEAVLPAPLNIGSPVLLRGPFLFDRNVYVSRGLLDFSQRTGVMRLAAGGQLLVDGMDLAGLAVQSLPGAGGSVRSALPLAAISVDGVSIDSLATPSSTASVYLYNSTLNLPAADYQALRALALVGQPGATAACTVAAGSPLASGLRAGIAQLALAVDGTAEPGVLALAAFVGWGLNATALRLVVAVDAAGSLQDDGCALAAGVAPVNSSGLSSGAIAGVVVGCVVGAALLGLAVFAALHWRRHSQGSSVTVGTGQAAKDTGEHLASCIALGDSMPRTLSEVVLAGHQRLMSQLGLGDSDEVQAYRSRTSEAELLPDATISGSARTSSSTADLIKPAHTALCVHTSDFGTEQHEPSRNSADVAAAFSADVKRLAVELNASSNEVRIEGVLGSGGYATVYLGQWRNLPVAIKTQVFQWDDRQAEQLCGDTAGCADMKQRFAGGKLRVPAIMEAAIAASVGHPNLVATYHCDVVRVAEVEVKAVEGGLQICHAEGTVADNSHTYKLFLVQELCAASLADALAAFANGGVYLTAGASLSVLLDIARGLSYLHSNGIIHGDLKPANVLLKPVLGSNPPASVAKLADYGLSVFAGDATHVSNILAGSPFYVAPEIVQQHRASPASDIFSLGIMMWETLTGNRPYVMGAGAKGRAGYTWNSLFPTFPPDNRLPPGAMHLTYWCLQRDPALRPTAAQVVHALCEQLGYTSKE